MQTFSPGIAPNFGGGDYSISQSPKTKVEDVSMKYIACLVVGSLFMHKYVLVLIVPIQLVPLIFSQLFITKQTKCVVISSTH